LRIHRTHNLGIEEAKRRVDMVAEEVGPKWNLKSRWNGDHMQVQGTGVSALIAVAADSVEVHVKTGLAMMMFRDVIRREIEGSIDDHIA
jgi:putative polyhydroxyalkanoate system protein